MIRAGLPVRADGRLDRLAAVGWYHTHILPSLRGDPEAALAGKSTEPPPEFRPDPKDVPAKPRTAVGEQQLELLTEKTLTARTKRLQLEGEVIAVAVVEQVIGEMIATAKSLFLRLPEELAERLANSRDPLECRSILAREIRVVLLGLERELATVTAA